LWQLGSPVEHYSASLVEVKRMIISKDVVALVSPLLEQSLLLLGIIASFQCPAAPLLQTLGSQSFHRLHKVVTETALQHAKNIRALQLEAGVESSALEYELLPYDIQNVIKLKDNTFSQDISIPLLGLEIIYKMNNIAQIINRSNRNKKDEYSFYKPFFFTPEPT
jgi:hypothetical protein